jgi:hypothetical protein
LFHLDKFVDLLILFGSIFLIAGVTTTMICDIIDHAEAMKYQAQLDGEAQESRKASL